VWQPALDEPDDPNSTAYRAISAFFGRMGLGIDLRKQTPPACAIHRWLASTKVSATAAFCSTIRSDESDRGFVAHGVVADDRGEALFALVWLSGRWLVGVSASTGSTRPPRTASRSLVLVLRSSGRDAVLARQLVLTGRALRRWHSAATCPSWFCLIAPPESVTKARNSLAESLVRSCCLLGGHRRLS
jgi:hypothetical protein